MQMSPRLHSLNHTSLDLIHFQSFNLNSKCYVIISGNIGFIQPYIVKPETDSEEEEWIIQVGSGYAFNVFLSTTWNR